MTARDGVPIPWGFGTFRVAGTLIACQPGKPTEHKKKKRQGKGGGPVQITYTYTRSHAVLVCEGPIIGIRRIWRNGKLVYDQTPLPVEADYPDLSGPDFASLLSSAIKSKASSSKFSSNLTIYLGDESQLPDPTLEAMFGAGEVGANRGIAYVVIEDDDVTDTAGAVPQYEFEVARAGVAGEDDYLAGLGPQFYYRLQGDTVDAIGNMPDLVPSGSYSYGENGIIFGSGGGSSVITGSGVGVGVDPDWTLMGVATITANSGSVNLLAGHYTNLLGGTYHWSVWLNGSLNLCAGYSSNSTVLASAPLELDDRFMWAFRKAGATFDLFINGSLVDTDTGGTGGFSSSGIFIVGSNFVGSEGHFIGYTRALTDAEISSGATYFLLDGRTYYQMPDGTDYYVTDSGDVVINALGVGETLANETVPLSTIVAGICARVGLEAGDIDVTGIADVQVQGYVIAR